MLAYLSRYTHRVAISNRRLIAFDDNGVTFKYKDYRADGRARYKRMTLATDEFIRRFLIHVLPHGFHRIRHYGLFANGNRAANIARARELLAVPSRPKQPETSEAAIDEPRVLLRPCPCCGGRMIIIETFARGCEPKHQPHNSARDQDRHIMMPSPPIDDRIDTRPLAGSQPAAPRLALSPQIGPQSRRQSPHTPCAHSFAPTPLTLTLQKADRLQALRPNPQAIPRGKSP